MMGGSSRRLPAEVRHRLRKMDEGCQRIRRRLNIDGDYYPVLSEKEPAGLPWRKMGIDVVFECTGAFRERDDLIKHIEAGARFVILSAPAKSEDVPTVIHGVSRSQRDRDQIISCASCTTNCITPVVEVMGRRIGVRKATMTTIHAYTSGQSIVDSGKKDFRRGRAGAANLVPASTGAAVATTRALPEFRGEFNGVAVRVPVPVGSLADIVFVTARETSVEEVNRVFREEAASERALSRSIGCYRGSDRVFRHHPAGLCVDRRSEHDPGGRSRSREGHELVRQRVGIREPDGSRGSPILGTGLR